MEARERRKEVTYDRKSAMPKMDVWRPELRLAGSIFAHQSALYLQKWVEEWNCQEPSNLYVHVKLVLALQRLPVTPPPPIAVIVMLRLWMSYRCAPSRDCCFVVSLKRLEIGSPETDSAEKNTYRRIPNIFFSFWGWFYVCMYGSIWKAIASLSCQCMNVYELQSYKL